MSSFLKIFLFLFIIFLLGCNEKNKHSNEVQGVSEILKLAEDSTQTFESRLMYGKKADSISLQQQNIRAHLNCLKIISDLYLEKDPVTAKEYLLETINVARQVNDSGILALSLANLGTIYNQKAEYDSAILLYTQSERIFKALGKMNECAEVMANLAISYKNQGDYNEAYAINMEGLKILENYGKTKALATVYATAGSILKDLNRLDEALQYHQLALTIFRDENDTGGIAGTLGNIGTIYRNKGEYSNALHHYFNALELKEKKGDAKSIATTIDNIGLVYFELNDYSRAENYLTKALSMREACGDRDGYVTTSNRLANVYFATCDLKTAEKIALQAKGNIPLQGYLKQKLDNDKILLKIYEKSGRHKHALVYADKIIALKDSIFNAGMAKKISGLKVRYETEKSEKENEILKRDKQIDQAKISQQRSRYFVLLIIACSVLIIAVLLFFYWRKKRNYEFNQQISDAKLEALNAQMSDHFISNAMDSINSFIENNDSQSASRFLLMFNRLTRLVLENSFKKLIPLRQELKVTEMYVGLERLRFADKALLFEIHVDESVDIDTTFIPPMVFQVLVENALRHAFDKSIGGCLEIVIEKCGESIKCIVTDNGMGRSASAALKPQNYERISFGVKLAEKLINIAAGPAGKTPYSIVDLVNDKNMPAGTKVEFILPYFSAT